MRNLKTAAGQEANLSKDLDGNFSFSVAIFFLFAFEKYTENVFFSKVKEIKLAKNEKLKNQNLWRIAQLLCGDFEFAFFIIVFF